MSFHGTKAKTGRNPKMSVDMQEKDTLDVGEICKVGVGTGGAMLRRRTDPEDGS